MTIFCRLLAVLVEVNKPLSFALVFSITLVGYLASNLELSINAPTKSRVVMRVQVNELFVQPTYNSHPVRYTLKLHFDRASVIVDRFRGPGALVRPVTSSVFLICASVNALCSSVLSSVKC